MHPKVAIIYLAYNAKVFLEDVAGSIEALTYPKEDLLFILVDNAAPDGSGTVIRETILPRLARAGVPTAFFPLSENLGYAGGNNVGIEHALLGGYEYVYLLNDDAKLDPRAIEESVRLMEREPSAGAVQSLVTLWQDADVVNASGGEVHLLGFGFVRENGTRVRDMRARDGEEIAFASGAAVLYRAKALQEVGLLDAHLFLYHEDLELGWRLRLAGWKNILSTKSIAQHHYEFSRSVKKLYWMERNRLLVHLSHLKIRTLLLLAIPLLILEVALFVFALKGGWWRQKLLAWRDLLTPASWMYLQKTRTKISHLRRVPDQEILRLFTGRIEHQETSNMVVERFANPVLAFFTAILKRLIVW